MPLILVGHDDLRAPVCELEFLTASVAAYGTLDLLSCRTTKSVDSIAGTFEIQLAPRLPRPEDGASVGFSGLLAAANWNYYVEKNLTYWSQVLRPMDVVRIWFRENARAAYPDMLGLIDRVGIATTIRGNTPTRVVRIIGRDMGKILEKDTVKFYETADVWATRGKEEDDEGKKMGAADVSGLDIYLDTLFLETAMMTHCTTRPPEKTVKFLMNSNLIHTDITVRRPRQQMTFEEWWTAGGRAVEYEETEEAGLGVGADGVNVDGFIGRPGGRVNLKTEETGQGAKNTPLDINLDLVDEGDRYLEHWELDAVFDPSVYTYSGSLANYIRQLVDKPYYEVFGETYPVGPPVKDERGVWCGPTKWFLVVRRTPFDLGADAPDDPVAYVHFDQLLGQPDSAFEEAMKRLASAFEESKERIEARGSYPEHEPQKFKTALVNALGLNYHLISDRDIITEEVGVSDEDFYSIIDVQPAKDVYGIDVRAMFPPYVCAEDVRRYGARSIDIDTRLVACKWKDDVDRGVNTTRETEYDSLNIEKWGRRKKAQAVRWFRDNDLYWSGNLTLKGRSDIRVGEYGYRYSGDPKSPVFALLYYVEGVTKSFNLGAPFETRLTVTRGQPIDPGERERLGFARGLPGAGEAERPQP